MCSIYNLFSYFIYNSVFLELICARNKIKFDSVNEFAEFITAITTERDFLPYVWIFVPYVFRRIQSGDVIRI